MRKPRDLDAELRALQERQRSLRARKTAQLGELVQALGADALPVEVLAGALLDAVAKVHADRHARETWRQQGEAFFRNGTRPPRPDGAGPAAPPPADDRHGAAPGDRRPTPG